LMYVANVASSAERWNAVIEYTSCLGRDWKLLIVVVVRRNFVTQD